MKQTTDLKVCPLCGRQDNGAPKCRDHPPLDASRVLARLDTKEPARHE